MPLYQIRTILKQDKIAEFSKSLRLLWFDFLTEGGCLSYRVYQEFEKLRRKNEAIDDGVELVARQAAARSTIAMLPEYDQLEREFIGDGE